jgi:hypothetical protein
MSKEFIPFTEALAIKELGYRENCMRYYNSEKQLVNYFNISTTAAPLYQQAFRFFREKYNLCFNSYPIQPIEGPEVYVGRINQTFVDTDNGIAINHFKTYEEAELTCLRKLIKIVQDGKK